MLENATEKIIKVFDWTKAVITREYLEAMPFNSIVDRNNLLEQMATAAKVQLEEDDEQLSLIGPWEYVLEAQVILAQCLSSIHEEECDVEVPADAEVATFVTSSDTDSQKTSSLLQYYKQKYINSTCQREVLNKRKCLPLVAVRGETDTKLENTLDVRCDDILGSEVIGENEVYVDITLSAPTRGVHSHAPDSCSVVFGETNVGDKTVLAECYQGACNLVYVSDLSGTPQTDHLSAAGNVWERYLEDSVVPGSHVEELSSQHSENHSITYQTPTGNKTELAYHDDEDDIIQKEMNLKLLYVKRKKKNYEELAPYKYFCKLCSFKSKRESHYQRHLRIHSRVSQLFSCDKCNFTTLRLGHLRRHKISHSETSYSCNLCHYVTDHHKFLLRHERIKHWRVRADQPKDTVSEKVLDCCECTYSTTRPHFFQRHVEAHNSSKNPNAVNCVAFQCQQCSYKTNQRGHYLRHVNNVHKNKRPYLCDHCGKAFKRPDALKQHTITHVDVTTGLEPYRCQVCDKCCRSQTQLSEHMSVHSNVRSFLCEICGSAFKTRAVQRKHVLTIHNNPRAFSCTRCSRKFNTKYALRRHTKQHSLDKKRKAEEANIEDEGLESCTQVDCKDSLAHLPTDTILIQDSSNIQLHENQIAVQVIGFI